MKTCSQRSATSVASVIKTESKSYSTFTISDGNSCRDYTVDVYPGKVYRVLFYDADSSKVLDVTGQITFIDSNALYLESIKAIDSESCLCESREYLNKVVTVYKVAIPVRNIYGIYPITEEEAKKPPKPPKPRERSVTIVGVLGISAEICRSVVVRVRVYDDDRSPTYEAVPVDMKVGNVYNITYFSRKDCSMYEVRGKLCDIEIMPKFEGDTKLNGYVRDEMPTEVVGLGDTIYDADHFHCLNKESPEGERIRFKFDTSEYFTGYYDYVWLKDIRNIDLLEGEAEDPIEDGELVNNCPNADTCPIINGCGECPTEPGMPPHYHQVCPPPHHHHPGPPPHHPPHHHPPHGCDDGRDYPCEAPWDPVPSEPCCKPKPDHPPVNDFVYCPLTAMPITEYTNCGDCEKLDECTAFEEYTERM